jgi:hypothetical protein
MDLKALFVETFSAKKSLNWNRMLKQPLPQN